MDSAQAVLTSACGVRQNGHIRVTDVTRVKSSKVGTILPRDCHAQSHVIVQFSPVSIRKPAWKQQVASGFGTRGMVPQGPNEAAGDDDCNEMTSR